MCCSIRYSSPPFVWKKNWRCCVRSVQASPEHEVRERRREFIHVVGGMMRLRAASRRAPPTTAVSMRVDKYLSAWALASRLRSSLRADVFKPPVADSDQECEDWRAFLLNIARNTKRPFQGDFYVSWRCDNIKRKSQPNRSFQNDFLT